MAANAGDSDDDYMSADILNQCGNTRPGLLSREAARTFKGQRRHEEKSLQGRTKPVRVLEKEKRESALQTAINQDNNKGFALMQKMGFKPGMSLGRTGQDGRKEPVPIQLKVNRSGLGHEKEVKRKREFANQVRMADIEKRKKVHKYEVQDYQSRKRNELLDKLTEKDLWNSQKVCLQLDEQKGVTEASFPFFWPKVVVEKVEEDEEEEEKEESEEEVKEDEEEELPTSEKLETLTQYLRTTYYYCVWCGTAYNDADDLQQNCPGNTRQDHDD